jgi:hypothetical protein
VVADSREGEAIRTSRNTRELARPDRLLRALAALCLLAACGVAAAAQSGPVIRPDALVEFVRPDGSTAARLVVEIADTPETRASGLMGRVLADHMGGMLFLFERAEPQAFWMRDTPTSLDIIFIDARSRVLNIAAQTTPRSDRTYASAGEALYVVEAKAGFAARFGVRQGFVMRWKPLSR